MANLRGAKQICEKYNKPLFLDACRFGENAWFIKQREEGYADKPIREIVREMVSYDTWAMEARNLLILTEGFPTYGGLSGRDLEAIAIGLEEVIEEDYLRYRIQSTAYLGNALTEMGVPIMRPTGGHAIYIDARALLPQIPVENYPGQALAVELYRVGGIRGCEIGTVMFGRQPDGTEVPADMDLVRLAIPRRVYTQSHIDYVIECFEEVVKRKDGLSGCRIVWEPPALRHFTAKFDMIASR